MAARFAHKQFQTPTLAPRRKEELLPAQTKQVQPSLIALQRYVGNSGVQRLLKQNTSADSSEALIRRENYDYEFEEETIYGSSGGGVGPVVSADNVGPLGGVGPVVGPDNIATPGEQVASSENSEASGEEGYSDFGSDVFDFW